MNKEELTTLLMLQGTLHCSCLEHCFLFPISKAVQHDTHPELKETHHPIGW